jgi:serine/threonine-protein kinase
VFAPAPGPNRTRALPELSVVRSAADARPPTAAGPAFRPPSTPPDGAAPAAAPGTEDAALAALLHRRRVIGLTALLVVIALALALAGLAWYFAAGPGAFTSTPKVVGLQVAQAQQTLQRDGLRSVQQIVYDNAVASGVVVSTDPDVGAPVRKDGKVILRVSQGPEIVKVPSVVGQTEDAARATLAAAHLTVQSVQQNYDDNQGKGQVLSVSPDVGQQVHNGSAVVLTVSKGPKPVDVPDLTGKTQDEAVSILGDLKLKVDYSTPRNDDTAPAGTVLSQSPSDGTLLPGQTVTLILSKGPVLVPVPNVVTRQFSEAKAILEAAGFKVRRSNVLGGFFGTVRVQFPAGGSQAPKGSTVLLTVV